MERPASSFLGDCRLHAVAAALVLTALNAVKPVHMDDGVYLRYAAEFAAHPLDPYAFSYGSPNEVSANNTLVPPAFPYWLGLGMRVVGDDPVLLKCWLFPIALLLAWSVRVLALRFAPSLCVPLIWLSVVSPTTLPGFNLMLDVPVLALGSAVLALSVLATERDSWGLCVIAGLLGGIAIQTKYTGLAPCVAMAAWFWLQDRPGRGLTALGLAIAIAVGWEGFVAAVQGDSHFLIGYRLRQGGFLRRTINLIQPQFGQMAGLGPAVALLAWGALGWSRRLLAAAAFTIALGFGTLATLPFTFALIPSGGEKPLLSASVLIYLLLGMFTAAGFVGVCVQLIRGEPASSFGREPAIESAFSARLIPAVRGRSIDWFLLAWLVVELGACFALSPFPAARRLVGPLFVFTLIAGRAAHLRSFSPRTAGWIAVFSVALSTPFYVADLRDAEAEKTAAVRVAAEFAPDKGGTTWSLCWWGFGHYAERMGMPHLAINRRMPQVGDLIAVHDEPLCLDALDKNPNLKLTQIDTVIVGDGFPLKTVPRYYVGAVPLQNQDGERFRVLIFRVDEVTELAR